MSPNDIPSRFHIMLAQAYPWPELVAQAQLAEDLSYATVYLPDQFVPPDNVTADWFECWTALAALAMKTNSIRLGTLVTHVVYRNPAILARQALTVDHLSNGRFELGVGAGGSPPDHSMTGVPYWNPKTRSERFHEAVTLIDLLLRQEETSYAGTHYQVEAAQIHPSPVQQPRLPLNIAAHGPRALRLAAAIGDAWNSFYPGQKLAIDDELAITQTRNEKVTAFAMEAGRNPARIRRMFVMGWTSEKAFVSLDSFRNFVARYAQAGITDFCLPYFPGLHSTWAGRAVTEQAMLKQIAAEFISS